MGVTSTAAAALLSMLGSPTITSWNRGAEQLYGYSADEVIGQSVVMLRSPERPDDITHMVERGAWRGERVARPSDGAPDQGRPSHRRLPRHLAGARRQRQRRRRLVDHAKDAIGDHAAPVGQAVSARRVAAGDGRSPWAFASRRAATISTSKGSTAHGTDPINPGSGGVRNGTAQVSSQSTASAHDGAPQPMPPARSRIGTARTIPS